MSADPVEILKGAFALKEAQRAAAVLGEVDEARISAVAAQLKLSTAEDQTVTVAGPNGESAVSLFQALGPPKNPVVPGFDEGDPLSWSRVQMREFVEKHGHEAYRAQLVAAAERRRRVRL